MCGPLVRLLVSIVTYNYLLDVFVLDVRKYDNTLCVVCTPEDIYACIRSKSNSLIVTEFLSLSNDNIINYPSDIVIVF